MTVSSTVSKSGPYAGNGVTTVFPYGFRILDKAHIRVVSTVAGVDATVAPAAYSVSGVGADGGGAVTFLAGPAAGAAITIIRDVPFTQGVDLENQGAYFAETVERALDQAVMRDQQIAEAQGRTLKFSASDTLVTGDLPSAAARAGRAIVFDEDGQVGISDDPYVNQTAAAQEAADDAAVAAGLAADGALTAQKWAVNPENTPVVTGQFSAFHWAKKAQAFASSAVAANVAFTPAGDVAATNVQAAIEELASEKATVAALAAAVTKANLQAILGGWYEPDGFRVMGATGALWMWEFPLEAKEWQLTINGLRPASGTATLTLRCGPAGGSAESGATDYYNQNILMQNSSFVTGAASQAFAQAASCTAGGSPRRLSLEGTLGDANNIWTSAAIVNDAEAGTVNAGFRFSSRSAVGRKPRLFLTSNVAIVSGDLILRARN